MLPAIRCTQNDEPATQENYCRSCRTTHNRRKHTTPYQTHHPTIVSEKIEIEIHKIINLSFSKRCLETRQKQKLGSEALDLGRYSQFYSRFFRIGLIPRIWSAYLCQRKEEYVVVTNSVMS
jgi:hypothetical protein